MRLILVAAAAPAHDLDRLVVVGGFAVMASLACFSMPFRLPILSFSRFFAASIFFRLLGIGWVIRLAARSFAQIDVQVRIASPPGTGYFGTP